MVVGVDIRWVSQALRERYPQQLSGAMGLASPVDYLEKVFQIPFWLPPMDAIGGERLLAAAIGPPAPRLTTDKVAAPVVGPIAAPNSAARPADNATPVPVAPTGSGRSNLP